MSYQNHQNVDNKTLALAWGPQLSANIFISAILAQRHHILVVGLMTLLLDWVYLIECSKFVFNSM